MEKLVCATGAAASRSVCTRMAQKSSPLSALRGPDLVCLSRQEQSDLHH